MDTLVRTTREYFLSDAEIKTALRLPRTAIIIKVERKGASYKNQRLDLSGCLVTTFDPKEEHNDTKRLPTA